MESSDNRSFKYQINRNDIITYINQEWLDFALENQSENLNEDSIIGSSLWHHIVNPVTVNIYETLIQKVRETNSVIKIPFRCDSPDKRRFMEMKITHLNEGTIEFTNSILGEEVRSSAPLLDPMFPRNSQLIRMCGWCKKVKTSTGWLEAEEAVIALKIFNEPSLPRITHGICPPCRDNLIPAESKLAG